MSTPIKFLVFIFIADYSTQLEHQNHPIRVIDIFTNYPSTDEILKDYTVIKQKRYEAPLVQTINLTSRSFNDYDEYYNPYRRRHEKNYYETDRKYYSTSGDALESEFGVFDHKNGYHNRYQDNYDRYDKYDKYVYTHGNKYSDYGHGANQYTINKPYTSDDNAENFKNKLNKFIAEVEKRPAFHTKKNATKVSLHVKPSLYNQNYADQFYFTPGESDAEEVEDIDEVQSEYGEIMRPTRPPKRTTTTRRPKRKQVTRSTTTTTTEKPAQSENVVVITSGSTEEFDTENTTRVRLTNLLRQYLVKMHRKDPNHYKKKEKIASIFGNFGNFGHIFDNPKAEIVTDYKLDEGKQKLFANPLESIKNKTMKFANKFLSLFTVIQFPNFKCQATSAISNYEGTCFLRSECATLNGVAMGNCADGHGVCCVFKGTCGGVGSNNCTYFESPGYPNYFPETGSVTTPSPTSSTTNPLTPDPRLPALYLEGRQLSTTANTNANALSCIFKVYKSNDSIRQMRIDFIDFELKGPTNGICNDERLVISGAGLSTTIPLICGYNTGQHIYVDVSSLSGPLQLAVLANTIERKRYKLRICQYSDGCSGLMNCLQYYTGITGTITSFNYEQATSFSRSTPQYLNNLNYAICIRREPGYCSITYTNIGPNNVQYPFELRNIDDVGVPTVPNGQAGVGVINCPDDYIVINGIRLCGQRLNDGSVIADFTRNAPVTDSSGGPIIIPVRTSNVVNGRGFKLFYMQNRCGTTMGSTGGIPDPRT